MKLFVRLITLCLLPIAVSNCLDAGLPEDDLRNKHVLSSMQVLDEILADAPTRSAFLVHQFKNDKKAYLAISATSQRKDHVIFALSEDRTQTVFQLPSDVPFEVSDKALRELENDKRIPAKLVAYVKRHRVDVGF